MADDFEYDFSENLESYFIVADSQEDQESELNKRKLMETLSALTSTKSNRECELDVPFSPRRCDLPQSTGNSKSRKAATGASHDNDPQQQGDAPPQDSGLGGSQGGGGSGGSGVGGGPGGGGGGGGQEPPGEGGGSDEGGDDTEEEEEEHVEEGTPTTSGESSGVVPPLIAAQAPQHAAPQGVLEHLAFQHVPEPPSNGHAAPHSGNSPHTATSPQGSGGGGISDAPTAVVTDSDHNTTIGTPTAPERSGSQTSPGDVGLSPYAGGLHDISSAHSTLSSFTSSSSDPQNALHSLQRKRPPARRVHQQSKKQKLMDVSTTDTSGRDTSTSKTDVTTTTVTTDTSHDESRSHQGEGGDETRDEDIGGSQQDLFDDNNSSRGPVGGGGPCVGGGPGGEEMLLSGLMASTPADKLQSLQFSGQSMMVPDTVTDDGSPEEVPPSQGVFGSQTPRIVPSSPTSLTNAPPGSQYEDADDITIGKQPSAEQSRPKSVHEWQPSYPGFESSSRSRTVSAPVHPGSSASLESRSAGRETASRQRPKVTGKGSAPDEPIESQDVEITSVEGSALVISRRPVVTGGDSMGLNLHLAESERTHQGTNLSVEESSVILLEPERTVINLETSSSEEHVQEAQGQDAALTETSQQLALHFSQSQQEASLRGTVPAPSQGSNTQLSGFKLSVPTDSHIQRLSTTAARDPAYKQQSQNRVSPHAREPVLPPADAVLPPPSLTLDMIHTMPEEDTQPSTPFTLFRPTVSPSADVEDNEKVTVFTKTKASSPRKSLLGTSPAKNTSLPTSAVTSSMRQDFRSQDPEKNLPKNQETQDDASARMRQMIRDNPTQDSEVNQKMRRKRAQVLAESQENKADDRLDCFPTSQPDKSQTPIERGTSQQKMDTGDRARFETLLGQATLEGEMENENTQEYEFSGEKTRPENKEGKAGSEYGGGNKGPKISVEKGDITSTGGMAKNEAEGTERKAYRGRGRGRKGSRGRRSRGSEGDITHIVGGEMDGIHAEAEAKGQGEVNKGAARLQVNKEGRERMHTEDRDIAERMQVDDEVFQEAEATGREGSGGRGRTNVGNDSDHNTHKQSKRGRGRGRSQGSRGRGQRPNEKSSDDPSSTSGGRQGEKQAEVWDSPDRTLDYKILKYNQDSPQSWYKKSVDKINVSPRKKPQDTKGQGQEGASKYQGEAAALPQEERESRQNLKTSLMKKPTIKKGRKGKKYLASRKSETSPQKAANISSDAAHEADVSRLTTLSTTGRNTSQLEHRTQSVQASSAQRLLVTMTTKTVYCRTETVVLDIVNGKVVGSNRTEKTEVLSENTEHEEDVCTTPSPSRTAQTLTSGDLGDISSFTDSHAHSKSSSLHTPAGTLARSRSTVGSSLSSTRSLHKKSLSATTIAKATTSNSKTTDSTSGDSLDRRRSLDRRQSRGLSLDGDQSSVQGRGSVDGGGRGRVEHSEPSDIPLGQVARSIDSLSEASKRTSDEHLALLGVTESYLGKVRKQGSVGRKPQRLSDAGKESASLFSTSDGLDQQATGKGSRRNSSSSVKNSESLFSAPASEADTQLRSNSESVFTKPTAPPKGGKRYSSDSSRKSPGQSTTESEVIPPTDSEKVDGRRSAPYIRGAIQMKSNNSGTTLDQQQVLGSLVDVTPDSPTGAASSGEKSDTDVVYLPPYRPTQPLLTGTSVMAMWKDKHYYPGCVQEVTTDKARCHYLIQFEDGNQRKVKDTEVIVCDLLAVGQECMATTNTETGWSEVCIVVAHHRKGTEAQCMVQFDDRRLGKIPRSLLCLSPDQARHLVTAIVSLPVEPNPTETASDQDLIPPTEPEEGVAGVTGRGRGSTVVGRRKKGVAKGKQLSESKEDVAVGAVSEAEEQEYHPEAARVPPTAGPLYSGVTVFAQWRDKCFYPGFIKELDKKNPGRYVVHFEDGDERSVHEDDLIVCELLPVGMNVLVQRDEAEWSESALILGHWKRGEVRGYKVEFEDLSVGKVGRGAVNLNAEQAATFFKEFLRHHSTPRPRLGDLSLENVVGGKRECSASTSSSKPKPPPKSLPKKRGPSPKPATPLKADVEELDYFPVEARMCSYAGTLSSGSPVFAQWRDKCFYPGFMKEMDKKSPGRYVVRFEDGDERSVHEDDLIVCELLPVGMNVLVQRGEAEWSESALILGHWKRGEVRGYKVEFEDLSVGKVGRSAVNLSSEQAATFVTEFLRPHTTPRPGLGDLSLENVVGGKRERSTPASPSAAAKLSGKGTGRKRGPQPRVDVSEPQSTGGKKRRLGVIEPKYTSTPTPKRQAGRLQEPADTCVGSPDGVLLDSPIQKKRTPMKSRHELFSSIKGPIPAAGSTIFEGYVCMLTHVDKTDEQKLREKPPELSTTDESLEGEQEEVPFDKEHLSRQIEGGGGRVVESFTEEHVSTCQCVVVSDSHQRTLKYLQGIALGKPCVSHIWIKDSCLTGSLQDCKSYSLPSGFCIETGRVLEMPEGVQPLRDCRLVVSSENPRFLPTWTSIVEAAGAKLLDKLPTPEERATSDGVLAVVADAFVPPSVVTLAARADIPVVSSEWLIQSLISGRLKGFNAHPKYRHNYEASAP